MNIYLDTCCYGREYDAPSQVRVIVEATVIACIIETCRIAGYSIVGSMAVTSEIGDIRQPEKRKEIETYLDNTIDTYYQITPEDVVRSKVLEAEGVGKMDSLHLAAAEAAGVDVLLTTDDGFIRICARKKLSFVRVINPVTFLPEMIK